MGIGPLEIGIVLVLLLVIFGPKKLPGLGRGLGSGMREFKEGIQGSDERDAAALHSGGDSAAAGTAAAGEPQPAATEPATPPKSPQE
ncbi:MAG: twin-arginine translocase TatA/TatE family subunit [Patulibacter sp.]